jgi:hypothetical protein
MDPEAGLVCCSQSMSRGFLGELRVFILEEFDIIPNAYGNEGVNVSTS